MAKQYYALELGDCLDTLGAPGTSLNIGIAKQWSEQLNEDSTVTVREVQIGKVSGSLSIC